MNRLTTLGNIIWFLFGGAITGIAWAVVGILWSITIIGIPIGKQCFKIASLCFCPFGKIVVFNTGTSNFLMNLIWISVTGWTLAVEAATIGLIYCITIVGIPFGKQYFKIAHLALTPMTKYFTKALNIESKFYASGGKCMSEGMKIGRGNSNFFNS